MVKTGRQPPLPRALVVLDNDIRSYRNAADFEEAVDAAASIGSAIVRAGLPVAPAVHRRGHRREILRVEDLTRMLDALVSVTRGS